MNETIVILANSVKNGEHCVAGKCLKNKNWFRPVGESNGKALSRQQIQVTNSGFNGSYAVKPLQKIDMKFLQHVPLINQPENWLIDNQWQWVQYYNIRFSDLVNYLDTPTDLWGHDNKVSYASIESKSTLIESSLYLVKVTELQLYDDPKYEYLKRKARFNYNGCPYDLSVTDPAFDSIFQEGVIINSAILCISLGEPFSIDNCCYKLVASIYIG
jgi:hypothetical protein